MISRNIFFLLTSCGIFFTPPVAFSQPNLEWEQAYGDSGKDEARFILPLSPDRMLLAGSTDSHSGMISYNHGGSDVWLTKTDSSGNLLWEKTYGGSDDDFAMAAAQDGNSGWIVGGYTYSNDGDVSGYHANGDGWIFRTDSLGNLLWQRALGGSGYDRINNLMRTASGDFMLIGKSETSDGDVSANHGGDDYWAVKMDTAGNLLWEHSFGGSADDQGWAVWQTSDGGFLLTGQAYSADGDASTNKGWNDYWTVKLDSSGALQWEKSYGGTNNDNARAAVQTSDGGYLVAGFTFSSDGDVSFFHGSVDYWVLKLDSAGVLLWEKTYGGSNFDYGVSLLPSQDGNYVVAGRSGSWDGDVSLNHGNEDAWIIKISDTGTLLWEKSLGGSGWDAFFYCIEDAAGRLIASGRSSSADGDVSVNHGSDDEWTVKLSGAVVAEAEGWIPGGECKIYPNPFSDEVVIFVPAALGDAGAEKHFTLYDLTGREMLRMNISPRYSLEGKFLFRRKNLPAGMYLYTLSSGNIISASGKLIAE